MIIIIGDRIRDTDKEIYAHLIEKRIKVVVVRTRMDETIKSEKDENKKDESDTIQEVRDHMKQEGFDPELTFLVSKNHGFDKMDWQPLTNKIWDQIIRMRRNIAIDSDEACMCCMDKRIDVKNLPCGHKVVCKTCWDKLKNSNKNSCIRCTVEVTSFEFL